MSTHPLLRSPRVWLSVHISFLIYFLNRFVCHRCQQSERRTFQTLTLLGKSVRFVLQMLGPCYKSLNRSKLTATCKIISLGWLDFSISVSQLLDCLPSRNVYTTQFSFRTARDLARQHSYSLTTTYACWTQDDGKWWLNHSSKDLTELKILRRTKFKRAHNSVGLFWRGVPVRTRR